MDGERFDDVRYRFVEEPEPPRPRRPRRARRWVLAGAAALIVAGGATAGASALTSSSPGKSKAAQQERALPNAPLRRWHNCHHMHYGAAGVPPSMRE